MQKYKSKALNNCVTATAFTLIGATCLVSQVFGDNYSMRLAHYFPLDSYIHEEMEDLSERLREKTDGAIQIDIHGGGVLGGDRELSEQVRMGAIHMANLGVTTQAALNKNFSIDELPYLWESYDQITEAYNSELGDYMSALMLSYGARPLGFFPFGYRHTTNSQKPLSSPSDFTGLKIRVSEIPIRLDAFKGLAAQPVPISFPELYTSLQQGAIDGQENPLFLIETSQFYEVQDYLSLTKHILNMNQIIINEAFYQSLPDELKLLLEEEILLSSSRLTKKTQEVENKALGNLKEKGMLVNDNIDFDKMREAMAPVYTKWEKEFDSELWSIVERHSSLSQN